MTGWFIKLFTKKVQCNQKTAGIQTVTTRLSNELKKEDSKVNVEQWVENQKALGVPLFDLWHKLMEKAGQISEPQLLQEYMNAVNKIEDILVSRNLDGKKYEQDGEDNKAIQLYEENVKDRFDGSHPYERLRVIYTKQKRYKDVIRICQFYIDNGQPDPQLKAKNESIIIKLREKD